MIDQLYHSSHLTELLYVAFDLPNKIRLKDVLFIANDLPNPSYAEKILHDLFSTYSVQSSEGDESLTSS